MKVSTTINFLCFSSLQETLQNNLTLYKNLTCTVRKKYIPLHRKCDGMRPSMQHGEMAEWSIAAVLKTVEGHTSGGSNPSLSAIKPDFQVFIAFTHEITHDF